MKIYNFQQNTPEWYSIRLGKLTASQAQAIGNCDKGLETLCWEKAAEIIIGSIPEQIENEDIQRGHDLEDEARGVYCLYTGNIVKQVGFVEYDEFIGCSPDGLIETDGLVEIKCKNNVNHLKLMVNKKPDSKYIWQMQMQMLLTSRNWCDFVSYNPNFKKDLIIIRVFADKEMQAKLLQGFKKGTERIKEILQNSEM